MELDDKPTERRNDKSFTWPRVSKMEPSPMSTLLSEENETAHEEETGCWAVVSGAIKMALKLAVIVLALVNIYVNVSLACNLFAEGYKEEMILFIVMVYALPSIATSCCLHSQLGNVLELSHRFYWIFILLLQPILSIVVEIYLLCHVKLQRYLESGTRLIKNLEPGCDALSRLTARHKNVLCLSYVSSRVQGSLTAPLLLTFIAHFTAIGVLELPWHSTDSFGDKRGNEIVLVWFVVPCTVFSILSVIIRAFTFVYEDVAEWRLEMVFAPKFIFVVNSILFSITSLAISFTYLGTFVWIALLVLFVLNWLMVLMVVAKMSLAEESVIARFLRSVGNALMATFCPVLFLHRHVSEKRTDIVLLLVGTFKSVILLSLGGIVFVLVSGTWYTNPSIIASYRRLRSLFLCLQLHMFIYTFILIGLYYCLRKCKRTWLNIFTGTIFWLILIAPFCVQLSLRFDAPQVYARFQILNPGHEMYQRNEFELLKLRIQNYDLWKDGNHTVSGEVTLLCSNLELLHDKILLLDDDECEYNLSTTLERLQNLSTTLERLQQKKIVPKAILTIDNKNNDRPSAPIPKVMGNLTFPIFVIRQKDEAFAKGMALKTCSIFTRQTLKQELARQTDACYYCTYNAQDCKGLSSIRSHNKCKGEEHYLNFIDDELKFVEPIPDNVLNENMCPSGNNYCVKMNNAWRGVQNIIRDFKNQSLALRKQLGQQGGGGTAAIFKKIRDLYLSYTRSPAAKDLIVEAQIRQISYTCKTGIKNLIDSECLWTFDTDTIKKRVLDDVVIINLAAEFTLAKWVEEWGRGKVPFAHFPKEVNFTSQDQLLVKAIKTMADRSDVYRWNKFAVYFFDVEKEDSPSNAYASFCPEARKDCVRLGGIEEVRDRVTSPQFVTDQVGPKCDSHLPYPEKERFTSECGGRHQLACAECKKCCIDPDRLCDGRNDCVRGEDERNCPGGARGDGRGKGMDYWLKELKDILRRREDEEKEEE